MALKVFCAGFGSVVAELLLKQESTLPFTVSFGKSFRRNRCSEASGVHIAIKGSCVFAHHLAYSRQEELSKNLKVHGSSMDAAQAHEHIFSGQVCSGMSILWGGMYSSLLVQLHQSRGGFLEST